VILNITSSLIPNLSYISEAAACVLDRQLRAFLVPHTEVVWVSSKSFHYDYWDRRAFYRKKKPLPPKVGSFQAFLQGYEGKCIIHDPSLVHSLLNSSQMRISSSGNIPGRTQRTPGFVPMRHRDVVLGAIPVFRVVQMMLKMPQIGPVHRMILKIEDLYGQSLFNSNSGKSLRN